MPQIRDKNFNRTARPLVPIRADRPHGWKHHFRGAAAELIGYLEFLSKKDPAGEFFVYATVDAMVQRCNRRGTGKPYSRIMVERMLEYFRALWIVSGVVERKRLNKAGEPQVFSGRIITPHHVFCESAVNGKYCAFKPGKFKPGHKWHVDKATKNVGRAKATPVVWYAGVVKKGA